jgi:hypothetical protein
MGMKERKQCDTCLYSHETKGHLGPYFSEVECRRHAPQVFGYGQEGDTATAWPRVAPEDSCGEFERTPD